MNNIETMSEELLNEFMLTFAYYSKKYELYDLKNIPSYIVIDWHKTAHDLMYDFNEKDSYYFSNNY